MSANAGSRFNQQDLVNNCGKNCQLFRQPTEMISMPLRVTNAIRRFEFCGVLLPDPAPSLDLSKVKEILALAHPEIATAEITGPTPKNGTLVFHVERAVGSKG